MLRPPVPTSTPTACRVAVRAQAAAHAASNLGTALSALRAVQDDCTTCTHRPTCHVSTWNADLDTAIRDIAKEWGLT